MIINQGNKCSCPVNLIEKCCIFKMYLDEHQHVCIANIDMYVLLTNINMYVLLNPCLDECGGR